MGARQTRSSQRHPRPRRPAACAVTPPVRWIEDGPPDAHIIAVGEAPGEDEVTRGRPFTGASGYELDRMLHEAGIERRDVFCTNVCHVRPPSYRDKKGRWQHNDIEQFFASAAVARREHLPCHAGRFYREPITSGLSHLHELLARRTPNLILALGNTPLWALAGEVGITKWRGSVVGTPAGKLLATFHPADVLRQWTHRQIVVQDFRRAAREATTAALIEPYWDFTVAPKLPQIREWCAIAAASDAPLVADIETLGGQIDCIGFASDRSHAICIPFFLADGVSMWSAEDEHEILLRLRTVMQSRPCVFHNAIYDCQVIAARWGFMPRLHGDTMAMQHVAYPGLLGGRIDPVTGRVAKTGSSLSLSFISSMYCEHYRYWKDDGKLWNPAEHSAEQRWRYNCTDCVRTFECFEALTAILAQLGLTDQYALEMRLFAPVFRMMFRGIRMDIPLMRQQRADIARAAAACCEWLDEAVGCPFNPDSTPQMRALFYDDLRLPAIKNRKTGALSLDDPALETIARRNPLLRPLIRQIQTYRTLNTIRADTDTDMLSADARLRFALNVAYVETMRFSCNETAFGEGSNLQNIPRPPED